MEAVAVVTEYNLKEDITSTKSKRDIKRDREREKEKERQSKTEGRTRPKFLQ